jgi:hypothetical protein
MNASEIPDVKIGMRIEAHHPRVRNDLSDISDAFFAMQKRCPKRSGAGARPDS